MFQASILFPDFSGKILQRPYFDPMHVPIRVAQPAYQNESVRFARFPDGIIASAKIAALVTFG
jgi:hypothetical protein